MNIHKPPASINGKVKHSINYRLVAACSLPKLTGVAPRCDEMTAASEDPYDQPGWTRRIRRNLPFAPILMQTHTVTSDPAVALELGRRLAASARRNRQPSPLSRAWHRVFNRHLWAAPTKRI